MGDLPISVWLGAGAIASALPLLWWAISAREATNRVAQSRMHVQRSNDLREVVLAQSAQERVVEPGAQWLAELGRRFTPSGLVGHIERRVLTAGLSTSWPVDRVLGVKLLLGSVLGMIFMLNWITNPAEVRLLVVAIAMAALGFFLPDVVILSAAKKRQEEIRTALPDLLDQITISVEAGLGFEAALGHVGSNVEGPIGVELNRTLQDIRLGMSRQDAFGKLSERVDVEEMRHFVLAMGQAEKLGMPIAEVLRIQAGEMRLRRRQYAEEEAQKLGVKMIFPLILCILPALVIVLLAPALFDFTDSFPSG